MSYRRVTRISPEQQNIILNSKYSPKEAADYSGVSLSSVYRLRKTVGIPNERTYKEFSSEEENRLIEFYTQNLYSIEKIADILGRTRSSINNKIGVMRKAGRI